MFLGRKKDAEAWKAKGGGAELRGHPRMSIKALVAVRAHKRKETNCKLVDLSLGGLALNIPYSLGIGDEVSLTLGPPPVPKAPKDPAYIDARVCRVVPSQKEQGTFQTVLDVPQEAHGPCHVRVFVAGDGEFGLGAADVRCSLARGQVF